MRLRTKSREDEAFDGLTAEDIRRIRGTASVDVTPGLESLAPAPTRAGPEPIRPKRGRRA